MSTRALTRVPGGMTFMALCALATSCFSAWDVGGPWACPDSGVCPGSLVCDDGVCCQPGANGRPACPTLPAETGCPPGSNPATFYRDRDGDGAGDPNDKRDFCRRPVKERWVATGGDCNDNDVGIGPAAPERCNAIDDDCDGAIDEDATLPKIDWKRDVDGDGFGDDCAGCKLLACAQPVGYVALGGDCAPTNPAVFPGAPEQCNNVDDNCNGLLDDPPYADVESPGLDSGVVKPCDTGKQGVCQAGGLQCLHEKDGGSMVGCVAQTSASTDVCSNGLDDDCNGGVDDAPGCGGPLNLLTEPGVTQGAFSLALPATVPTVCQKGVVGAKGMAWLNPVWIGSDANLHVWWAEPPRGEFWDLRRATTLHLPIRTTVVNEAAEGTWNTPLSGFPNSVVALCGPLGVVRYVPMNTARITSATTSVRVDVPLQTPSADWSVLGTPLTSLAHVTRVELWMSPRRPDAGIVTFSNTFLVDAGVPGFR